MGTLISRYGETSGKFVSPYGTSFGARGLPPYLRSEPLKSYEILKPFEVQSGIVAPAFNQAGLGIQYELPVSAKFLIKREIIREIGSN